MITISEISCKKIRAALLATNKILKVALYELENPRVENFNELVWSQNNQVIEMEYDLLLNELRNSKDTYLVARDSWNPNTDDRIMMVVADSDNIENLLLIYMLINQIKYYSHY